MKILRMICAACLSLLFTAPLFAKIPTVLSVKDMKPGTKAIGFSVFQGTEPEQFEVELGEPINYGLGRTMILSRIHGTPVGMDTPLEVTGPIAGMSGSPIFIGCKTYAECLDHGILVGALAYGFIYQPKGGMNTGLTPAEDMLGAGLSGQISVGALDVSNISFPIGATRLLAVSLPNGMMPIPAVKNVAVSAALKGGTSSISSYCAKAKPAELKPGSMIYISLAEGDYSMAAWGTVTWRDGDKIYAFGHPFFASGVVRYPFTQISVATTFQSALGDSFKMAGCSVGNEGVITFDGKSEVAGVIGGKVALIPFDVKLHSGKETFSWHEEIVPDTPFTPIFFKVLPGMWAMDTVGTVKDLAVRYTIRIVTKGEREIFSQNSIVPKSGVEALPEVFLRTSGIIENLNASGFPHTPESISVDAEFQRGLVLWEKEKIFLSKEKAAPGETVTLSVILRSFPGGEKFQRMDVPVTIPADFFSRIFFLHGAVLAPKVSIFVQGGTQFVNKKEQKAPRSLGDLILQLNSRLDFLANTIYVQEVLPPVDHSGQAVSPVKKVEAPVSKEMSGWQVVSDASLLPVNATADVELEVLLRSLPMLNDAVNFDAELSIDVVNPVLPHPQPQQKKKKKHFLFF